MDASWLFFAFVFVVVVTLLEMVFVINNVAVLVYFFLHGLVLIRPFVF